MPPRLHRILVLEAKKRTGGNSIGAGFAEAFHKMCGAATAAGEDDGNAHRSAYLPGDVELEAIAATVLVDAGE